MPSVWTFGINSHREQVRGWITSGKLDLVKATLHALKIYLQPQEDFAAVKANRKQWSCLARFLYDLPGDLLAETETYFTERKYPFPEQPKK